jgi:AcrR family transcriptional regulator
LAKPSVTARKVEGTRSTILDAAKQVLRENGYSGFSTRDVALAAGVPLSQIHYHFGSKQGLVAAMFEYQNAQLLHRQEELYADPSMPLWAQWERACDYLDEDLKSGYVRALMELWAAGWSDQDVAKLVRDAITGWMDLLTDVARRAEKKMGQFGPFSAEDISALVGAAFIGAEAYLLLDFDAKRVPIRRALRRFGVLIKQRETRKSGKA